jgi:uncharacterized protein with PIN domain
MHYQKTAHFRFYEELNDFIPKEKKKKTFAYPFSGKPTVKDAIEACGVPHPEVEIILVNHVSVGFDYHLHDGDRVAVYPMFESIDISPLLKLREKPLRECRFVVDVHLHRLVRGLRMLGFDVFYKTENPDREIIRRSINEKRIILTRDKELLKHRNVTHGYWVRATVSEDQLKEVLRRFDLHSQIKPFTRCMICNSQLKAVEKKQIKDKIPEKTATYYSEFYRCRHCNQIYWPGSHYQKMQQKIERLKTVL